MTDKKNDPDNREKNLSRRAFISAAAGAALVPGAVLATGCNRAKPTPKQALKDKPIAKAPKEKSQAQKKPPAKKAMVVLVRDEHVLGPGNEPKADVLAWMLDTAVGELLSKEPDDAWNDLLRSNDVLGIKSNEWRFLATPGGLEQAIKDRALKVGIAEDSISISDRGVKGDPVFKKATALINVRPLRTHHWSGVGSLIKNYIMFADDLPSWHPDACADLGGLWHLPAVKGKTRLNILVMLTPLFHGKGPHHFQADYTWPYRGLIVGTDPVAVDATGVRILKAKRKAFFGKDEPLAVSPKHIEVADSKFGLGVSNPDAITIKRMGWMKDALV
ncbi:MAG: hypothetical protein QNJ97_04570 [Myxococcota bacterium]|nr:hypothetical protein [Myxococcota bacterium]